MNGPYSWGYEPVSGLTSYRVADASNNRVATCYSDANARDVTDALNDKWQAEQPPLPTRRTLDGPTYVHPKLIGHNGIFAADMDDLHTNHPNTHGGNL